jgi:hypothetical protein
MVNFSIPIDQKSDEKAYKFRESGNDAYNHNKHLSALTFYNKSITYASSKKVRALGYANRSAIYLTLGYYDECLKNIEWARENDYPTDKLENLKKREVKCKNLMLKGEKNIAEDPWNFFKLSYPANEKIPWLINCLDVRSTEKYGRGVYATKDLKAGDVISIEEPFITCIQSEAYYQHCASCFKTNMLSLLPCLETASMMFCSSDCMNQFYSKTIDMDAVLNMDMRLLSVVSAKFGGYKKFDYFINRTCLNDLKKTIFDYDLSNPKDPVYHKNIALCFLSLSSQKDYSANDDSCNIYKKYVSKKTANHLLSLMPLNLIEEFYAGEQFTKVDSESISLFKSLINHSCCPNVFFIHIENKIVGFVVKPIKAGEQLFRCYFIKDPMSYNELKSNVFQTHNFKCDCQECINNSRSLKWFTPTCMIISRKSFVKAKELLKESWQKLNSGSKENYDHELQTFIILTELAYYATFPY